MAFSSNSSSILFFLLVLSIVSVCQSIPFSNLFRQMLDDSEDVDDELADMSPGVSMEPSPEIGMTQMQPIAPSISPAMSEEPTITPSVGEDEVCIDIKYLNNVPSHHLVHSESFPSTVFCPLGSSLPCATGNHMIRINGQSLSYHSYCQTVQCEQKENVMVNSVLSHIWTEESHGNNIHLTMFDARHPEIPQLLLHRFIAFKRRFI